MGTVFDLGCFLCKKDYAFVNPQLRFEPTSLGIALCQAYDRMQLTLSKPYLRANMESRMKMISQGRLDKQTFLNECLQEMKRVLYFCKLFLFCVCENFDKILCAFCFCVFFCMGTKKNSQKKQNKNKKTL